MEIYSNCFIIIYFGKKKRKAKIGFSFFLQLWELFGGFLFVFVLLVSWLGILFVFVACVFDELQQKIIVIAPLEILSWRIGLAWTPGLRAQLYHSPSQLHKERK